MTAIISALSSIYVFVSVIIGKSSFEKQFHRLCMWVALFDIIQCISVFLGPRYEQSTNLCRIQEYLFQFGLLYRTLTATVICLTTYYTLKHRVRVDYRDKRTILCYSLVLILFICSIIMKTGDLYCPFNHDGSANFHNIHKSSSLFSQTIAYFITFIFPLMLCFSGNIFLTFLIHTHARHLKHDQITRVSHQIKLYPAVISIVLLPLTIFLLIIFITGKEYRILMCIGAILLYGNGCINACVYYYIGCKESRHVSKDSLILTTNFAQDFSHAEEDTGRNDDIESSVASSCEPYQHQHDDRAMSTVSRSSTASSVYENEHFRFTTGEL